MSRPLLSLSFSKFISTVSKISNLKAQKMMQSSGHKRFFVQICRKLQKARHTQHQSIDVVQLSQLRVANSSMWNMVVAIRKTPRSAPALGIIKLMKYIYIPGFCLQNWWEPPRGQWWMSKTQVFMTCVFFSRIEMQLCIYCLSCPPCCCMFSEK